ncbi:MAG: hypothetical protein ACP5EP_00130 [Acidobacteriaceae bacterium]
MYKQKNLRQQERSSCAAAWTVVAIVTLGCAPAAMAQNAATPPTPPSPAAPPSATISNPGQPQISATPVIMMNAPNGQAGGGATGMPGASILVVPTIGQALQSPQAQLPPASAVVLPAGTKILLALKNAVDIRSARVGDAVYLQSSFPVVVGDHVALPAGTYVQGQIDAMRPAGGHAHRAGVRMHLTTMILQNGRVISIPGPLENLPGQSNASRNGNEGAGQASSGKGSGAWSIAQSTTAGAGTGTMPAAAKEQTGKGPRTGSHAGTGAGLECSVFAKGNAVVIPRGTSVEMVLQSPLALGPKQNPGQPSPATGPPNYTPSPN